MENSTGVLILAIICLALSIITGDKSVDFIILIATFFICKAIEDKKS
jgi:hypothetical protein